MKAIINTHEYYWKCRANNPEFDTIVSLNSFCIESRLNILKGLLEQDRIEVLRIDMISDLVESRTDEIECKELLKLLEDSGKKIELVIPENLAYQNGYLYQIISRKSNHFTLINQ